MKNAILLAAALLVTASVSAFSATDVIEYGVRSANEPVSVLVSTSTYTNVTSTTTRSGDMTALLFDNPSTNTSIMHGHVGGCTSTAVATTVLGPIEIHPSSGGGMLALQPTQCLWMLSRATSAENLTVQGVSQKR